MRYWLLILSLLWVNLATAQGLPEFTSQFRVITFGTELGKSTQKLQCRDGLCTLTATAKPEGIARLFTSEWLWEQSHFELKDGQLNWLKYEKKKYDGNRLKQQITLIREKDKVHFQEGNKYFPLNTPIFDALSLPFAISLMHQQKQYPSALYLQDNNWQDRLTFTQTATPEEVEGRKTIHFKLKGKHIEATLDLLAHPPYLPYAIDIYNKKHKRHIILTLDKDYATQ